MLFKYEKRARQLIDYETLSWGDIHPTDVDGCLEFGGYKLVLLEYKYGATPVGEGQRHFLERLSDNWNYKKGNVSIVIVAEHFTSTEEIVDGGNAIVREVYFDGKWRNYNGLRRTVKSIVENFAKEEIGNE